MFHVYTVRARDRDALGRHLASHGIGTQVYYRVPLHRQPALAGRCDVPAGLPETERAATEVLALPMYPQLTEQQVDARRRRHRRLLSRRRCGLWLAGTPAKIARAMKAETPQALGGPEGRGGARRDGGDRSHGFTVLEAVTAASEHSEDLQETLQHIVEVIARRTNTDVCSIYLLEPRVQRLTLRASTGLVRSAVGKVVMSVGEGLTGIVIEKLEPVMAVDAMSHPRYKFFPETGEERYHSFLGVPILERGTPLGVLVVQTLRRRKFSGGEVRLLRAIAAQLAGVLVQARLVEDLRSKEKEREYRDVWSERSSACTPTRTGSRPARRRPAAARARAG